MFKLHLDNGSQWTNPEVLYGRLHEHGGVGPLAGIDGIYCASYTGCHDILSSSDWSLDMRLQRTRSERSANSRVAHDVSRIPTLLAPEDTPMRGVAVRALRLVLARLVNGGAAEIVTSVLDACEDEIHEVGAIDAIERITDNIIYRVMREVTGIDYKNSELLSRVMASFTQTANPGEAMAMSQVKEAAELSAAARVEARRVLTSMRASVIPDSLAGQLASTPMSSVSLTDRGDLLLLVWLAGTGTARSFLGSVVIGMALEPEAQRMIATTADAAGPVIWELARMQAPVQAINRVALRDTDVCGMPVTKGQVALLLPGAANRDPMVYPDPDRFMVRHGHRPLVFGSGVHTCLGSTLGVSAAQELAIQLVRRYPEFQLEHAEYRNTIAMREPASAVISGLLQQATAGVEDADR